MSRRLNTCTVIPLHKKVHILARPLHLYLRLHSFVHKCYSQNVFNSFVTKFMQNFKLDRENEIYTKKKKKNSVKYIGLICIFSICFSFSRFQWIQSVEHIYIFNFQFHIYFGKLKSELHQHCIHFVNGYVWHY